MTPSSTLFTRVLSPLTLALCLLTATAFAAPDDGRRVTDSENPLSVRDVRLRPEPADNLEDLTNRLEGLGATPARAQALAAALRGDKSGSAIAAAASGLDLPAALAPKLAALLWAYETGQPVSLVGLTLPVEEQVFLSETLRLGVEPGAAGWLLLKARSEGWPEQPAEREILRDSVRRVTGDLNLQDAVLDTAVLRRDAAARVSGEAGRRLQAPDLGPGLAPATPEAVCDDCPAYRFSLSPTETWQTHSAVLEPGQCTVYRFAVAAGEAYQYSFCDGGGSAPFDSVLIASDQGCAELGRNDDGCGSASDLVVVSPFRGFMYVQVSAKAGESGPFTLAFRRVVGEATDTCSECPNADHAPDPATTVWQTFDSAIGSGGCRLFSFLLINGHTYRFTTCEEGSGGTAGFDTVIESAIGSQGCELGPGNDDACGLGSTLELTVQGTQYVTIRVSGFDDTQWGPFTLAYKDVTGECLDCPETTIPAVIPSEWVQTTAGQLAAGGGCDVIPIQVEAGKSYSFSGCAADGGASEFIMSLEALDESCSPLGSQTEFACGAGTGRSLVFQPCYTGTVYLRVSETDGLGGGAYALAYTEQCSWVSGCRDCIAQHLPNAPTTAWQTADAFLPANGCRVFAFDLEAYKTYRFSGCQGGGSIGGLQDVRFRIRNGDCSACAPGNAGTCGTTSPRIDFTPETSGTYFLVLEERNGESDSVSVAYRERDANCTAPDTITTISPGDCLNVPGSLTVKSGANLHEFQGLPGRTYRFNVCANDAAGNSCGGGFDPGLDWIMVNMTGGGNPCAPDAGAVLTNDDCPGHLDIVAPADGKIVIKVARRCGSPGGSYGLNYSDLTRRVAFVTSGRYQGDLDGSSGPGGGDGICNFLARSALAHPTVAAAAAGGATFMSWLSDSTSGAWARLSAALPPGDDGYILPDGTPIVATAADLITPADLLHPIDMTEQGVTLAANFATWTGTDEWGDWTGVGTDCSSWSVGFATSDGTQGLASQVDGRWSDQTDRPCDRRRHIYCFETP